MLYFFFAGVASRAEDSRATVEVSKVAGAAAGTCQHAHSYHVTQQVGVPTAVHSLLHANSFINHELKEIKECDIKAEADPDRESWLDEHPDFCLDYFLRYCISL